MWMNQSEEANREYGKGQKREEVKRGREIPPRPNRRSRVCSPARFSWLPRKELFSHSLVIEGFPINGLHPPWLDTWVQPAVAQQVACGKLGEAVGPLIDELHFAAYGCTRFDRQALTKAWEKHEAKLDNYFSGRSSDLLRINIDQGDLNYPTICSFLECEIPNFPFPQVNQRTRPEASNDY